MVDVFISYGHQDRDRITPIVEALTAKGLTVWWAPKITFGAAFRAEIAEALAKARSVIVFWSRHSVRSDFVQDEADDARRRGILFPVLLDLVDIPLGFRQIQTVDLTQWRARRDDPGVLALIGAVEQFLKPTPASGQEAVKDRGILGRLERKEVVRAPAIDRRVTTTGEKVRQRLFLRSALLAAILGVATVLATFLVVAASEPIRNEVLSGIETRGDFDTILRALVAEPSVWALASVFGGAVFLLMLVARYATFWADRISGTGSLRLFSRSVVTLALLALVGTAPIFLALPGTTSILAGGMNFAALSLDGAGVVTGSFDRTARLWDAETGREILVLRGHEDLVTVAAFSPDGRRVVTASRDTTARLWDVATGQEIAVLRGHEDWVTVAAFSPDGRRVVTASDDHTARLWDAETGQEIAVLRGHEDWVRSAAFSPDGRRVVTASWDATARLWDAGSRQEIAILRGHTSRINYATFSSDGRRVVTASFDTTARLWEAATGKEIAVLRGHEGDVNTAAFSPDGRWVVTAADDNTARLWDTATGQEIAVLGGREQSVTAAAFSPDGARVVTVDWFGLLHTWDVTEERLVQTQELRLRPVLAHVPGLDVPFMPLLWDPASEDSTTVEGWLSTSAVHGVALVVLVLTLAALLRAATSRFLSPAAQAWLPLGIAAALAFYLALVYLTNLPAEALLVWLAFGFLAIPLLAIIRLLTSLLVKPAAP